MTMSVSPGYGTVKIPTVKTMGPGASKNHIMALLTGEEVMFELTEACMRHLNTMMTATHAHETSVRFDCII